MTKEDRYIYSEKPTERAFLVGVDFTSHRYQTGFLSVEDSLEELATLAETAQVQVVGGTIQRLSKPHAAGLIGSGKIEELNQYKDELTIDVFIFDDELSPRQQRVLEKALSVKILDRTALILDIFARHARTREGQLQVELAQLEYRLPRLTRMWTHLARQAGGRAGGASGGVGVRGPGETQLEVDRREINRKITYLKSELEKVRAHRSRHRERRRLSNISVAAIVGYTNAGKSTLINALMTKAGTAPESRPVYAADQLFATLDPTTRQIQLPSGLELLFSDTVGFIQKLPTELVAAFRATLEEVETANILIHVIDITHPNATEQADAVEETLDQLGVTNIPVISVFNKVDQLPGDNTSPLPQTETVDTVMISAKTGVGLDDLLAVIERKLQSQMLTLDLFLPYQAGQLVSLLHTQGVIERESHHETGSRYVVKVPQHLAARFDAYHYQETEVS